jgi:hypothetical protein
MHRHRVSDFNAPSLGVADCFSLDQNLAAQAESALTCSINFVIAYLIFMPF